jgi:rSAM/selenodomain-associated transferase 1
MVTLVFVRAPEAGRVKTRLAATLGAEGALRVYRRLAEHTLREARAVGGEVRVHFTPADAGDEVRAWLGDGPRYLPQSAGDLGARMEAAFRTAFEDGAERVVIIGSDLPELSAALLRRAFGALETHPAVIGPARDGGYYLLGMRTMIGGLFDAIPWSTDQVLARTLDRLRAAGIEPAFLDTLSDVDEMDDLPAGWAEWARTEAAS